MVKLINLLLISLSVFETSAYHEGHRVACTRKKLCNGSLMCAYVCDRGTVEVDEWAAKSLSFQRTLQRSDSLLFLELPSTHNSAITEADGFGIEKYFISALNGGLDLDQGDDVGEGLCHYMSLTDQLRIGIRHLEIDIWWDRLVDDLVVCHSPIPLYPVGQVNRKAAAANLTLDWDPKNMSCLGTKRAFTDVLTEVYDWMIKPENTEEIVVLFFDTKFYLSPSDVTKANNEIRNIFGSMLWPAADGSPLTQTLDQFLNAGKRIFIENARAEWQTPSEGEQVVFYPTFWSSHQFGTSSFVEFPNCTIQSDNNWYGKEWVRALDGSIIESVTRCGGQLVSGDYINPDEMRLYVWSWDLQEPSLSTGCTAMLPSGRWATLDCSTKLPTACLRKDESQAAGYDLDWVIDVTALNAYPTTTSSACADGLVFAAPHNGYSNAVLLNLAFGQTVWLNAPNPLKSSTYNKH